MTPFGPLGAPQGVQNDPFLDPFLDPSWQDRPNHLGEKAGFRPGQLKRVILGVPQNGSFWAIPRFAPSVESVLQSFWTPLGPSQGSKMTHFDPFWDPFWDPF